MTTAVCTSVTVAPYGPPWVTTAVVEVAKVVCWVVVLVGELDAATGLASELELVACVALATKV